MEETDLKVYDENGNLLEEYDEELGRLDYKQKVKEEHPAKPEVQEEHHYEVETFYFEDGTSLTVESQDDPHIKKIDPEMGIFEYVDQGEGKELRGIDLKQVTDVEYQAAKPAWTEYEYYYVYVPYTEEELEAQRADKEQQEKQQNFINTGAERLEKVEEDTDTNTTSIDALTTDIDDMMILMAEMIGVE